MRTRHLFALWLFLIVGSAAAEIETTAIQCTNAYDAKSTAICANPLVMAKASEIERAYLFRLSQSKTVQEWLDAWIKIKLQWASGYTICGGKLPQYMTACIDRLIADFIQKVPPVPPSFTLNEGKQSVIAKHAEILDQAKSNLSSCAVERASALDDGVSPARDVAIAIAKACKPAAVDQSDVVVSQFGGLSLFSETSLSLEKQFALSEQLSAPESFMEVVLQVRAARRSKQHKQIFQSKSM